MNKKIFVSFAVLLTSIILSSCSSKSENVSKEDSNIVKEESSVLSTEFTESITITDSESVIMSIKEEQLENNNNTESYDISTDIIIDNSAVSYDISGDAVQANLMYNTEMVFLPESVDGKSYFPCGINNNKVIIAVNIVDTLDEYICEYGLLDPVDNSYEVLITNKKDTYYNCSYGDYYVFNLYQTDMNSLEYYNSQTKKSNIIFNYINDFTITENQPIIYDGKLYFDVYTTPDRDYIDLYEYDFTSGELVKKVENAAIPMASASGLKYVNFDYYENGADKIVTFSDKSEFSILNKRLMDLVCVGDEVFGLANEETGGKGSITKFQRLQEGDNDITILSTALGELLHSLIANDFCVAWNDETGGDNSPCVYDISSNKIVVFDDMEKCYYRTFLQRDKGLIFDVMKFNETHQICLFSPKEN